jgi:biopolymer transport protein ExbB/TolQ
MDPLVIFLVVILSILTVLLVVVGIQVFYLVKEARGTLKKYNRLLTKTDRIVTHVSDSLDEVGESVSGLKSGLKLVEAFSHWVQKHQDNHDLLPE